MSPSLVGAVQEKGKKRRKEESCLGKSKKEVKRNERLGD